MKTFFTLSVLFLFTLVSEAQTRYFKGILQGSQEVPPVVSTGGGVVIVKYNMATKTFDLIGNYSGLTGPINNSHVHRGPIGVAGPVIIPLANTGSTAGTISARATVTQGFEDSLFAGNTYANVHSTVYPGGELRAQLTPTTDGQTEFFTARAQGAQEVPPNPSLATGNITALLDKTTLQVYLTGDFHNLSANASASHIHRGPVGVSGPVIVPLSATADTSGSAWGTATVSSSFADSMVAGNTYFNIHNPNFPGGEIRGQLLNLSQTRFLKATLQGSQEVPANASVAKGTVIVKYNPATLLLELVGDYQNLSNTISSADLYSPAPVGSNAPILRTLNKTGGTSGVVKIITTINASQESDLLSGLMYVNIVTSTYSGGEIRGQLTATTAGETQYFTNTLSGTQEVPPNASTATGSVTALLDKITNQVYVTGDFHNLSAAASAAHLHRGLTGISGPVIVPISATADTSGTITGSAIVSSTFADSMIRGFTYVNIHNALFPGGEIRGQLGDLVLPVKLEYFNGYKNNNQVVLIWQTALEQNVKNYEVEQQNTETGEWLKKVSVAANGGNSTTKYSITDIPALGKKDYVLYRLKTIDISGSVTYSSIVRINYNQSQLILSIAPNPVTTGKLVLSVSGMTNPHKAEITVIDFLGRIMSKTPVSTLSNNTIDISKLSRGMYKLIVTSDGTILQANFSKQ